MDDWLELAQLVAPLILGVGAYFLGGLNERKRDQRTLEREEAARRHLRRESVENERHAFQQETLLELQESIIAVARNTAQILMADRESINETGSFRQLPESIGGADAMEVRGNFNRLANRILDDGLRAELLEFGGVASSAAIPPSDWKTLTREQAEARVRAAEDELVRSLSRAQESLGVALRAALARHEP